MKQTALGIGGSSVQPAIDENGDIIYQIYRQLELVRDKMDLQEGFLSSVKTIALNRPTDFNAQYGLGVAYRALGYNQEALASFRKSLEIEPWQGMAHDAIKRIKEELVDFRYPSTKEPSSAVDSLFKDALPLVPVISEEEFKYHKLGFSDKYVFRNFSSKADFASFLISELQEIASRKDFVQISLELYPGEDLAKLTAFFDRANRFALSEKTLITDIQ